MNRRKPRKRRTEKRANKSLHNKGRGAIAHLDSTAVTNSRGLYEALFQNSCEALFLTDRKGQILETNKAARSMIGYSNKELIGRSLLFIHPKKEHRRIKSAFRTGLKSGHACLRNVPVLTKSGTTIFVDAATNIIESEHGSFVQTILSDITHHMQTEDELRKTVQKLSLAIEGSSGFPWECWFDAKRPGKTQDRFYLSPGAKNIIGYRDHELPNSIRAWYRHIIPEDLKVLQESAQKHLDGKSNLHQVEYRIRHKDGSIRWIRSCGRIERDADAKPKRWVGIHWDITRTRQAVQMLSESAQRYRTLVEGLPDIVWSFSTKRGTVYVSSRVKSILGYTPSYLYTNPWLWKKSIHHDDQRRVTKAVADFVKGKDFAIEYRIKDATGSWHWFLDRSVGRRKSKDDLIIEGVSTDISEQMLSTEQLRLSEESYRELTNSITDVFFEMDKELRYTYWNNASERLTGIPAKNAIGKAITDIFPDNKETRKVVRFYRGVLRSQKPARHVIDFALNGTNHSFEINAYPSMRGISVIVEDITLRKQVDETIRRRDAILAAVSSVAEQFLRIRPWGRVVNNALKSIANAAGVCRAYVFENHFADDGTLLTSKRYEWTGPSCQPQLQNPLLQNTTYAKLGFTRWPKILSRGEPIHSPVHMLPASERKTLTAQGVKSIAIMPIFVGGKWWGFTGFNECRRDKDWSNAEIEALKAWAEMLSSALHRRQIEARIAEHSAEQVLISNIARIVGNSLNLQDILRRLMNKTMAVYGCEHGAIYLVDRESRQYRGFVFRGVFSKMRLELGTLKIDARKITHAITSHRPISITDSQYCHILWRNLTKKEGMRTVLLAPLVTGDTIQGVLALASKDAKNYDDRELNLFSPIGRYAGHAIEKARLYNAAQHELTERRSLEKDLRQSEARYRAIFDTAPDMILTFDLNGKVTSCNRTVRIMTGFRVSDFVGRHFSELALLLPEDILKFTSIFSKALSGAIPHPFRVTWKTIAGELRNAEVRASILKKGKRISGLQIIARDVTESARHELMIKRRDAIFEAIAFAAEKFLRTVNWTDAIQDVLQRLGEAAEVSRTYLFQNHRGKNRTLLASMKYEWTAPNTTPQIDNPMLQGVPYGKSGFERWSRVMRQGRQILGHVREFPPREKETLANQDIKSILTVPVFVGNEWWGFIGFDECQYERQWSTAAIEALKIAANEIGVAIQRARVHDVLKYQADLLNDVSDAIISTDLKFRIISWNRAAEHMYGWKADEVIGKSVSDITHIEYPNDKTADVVHKFFKEGFWNGEVTQRHRNGASIDVLASVSLVKDGSGTPIGAVTVNHDITEEKKAEDALVRSEAKYRGLIENTNVGIVSIDTIGRFIYVNQTFCKMLGYHRDELLGRRLAQFLHEADRKTTIDAFLGTTTKTRRRTSLEFRAVHKNAQIVNMLSNPTFIKQRGKIVEIHAIIENISRRKEAERVVRHHLKLENKLAKISERLVKTRDVASALDETLADLANLFTVDRALLAQRDEKRKNWHITHEWHSKGLSSVRKILPEISEEEFSEWFIRLKKHRYISITDTAQLPKPLIDKFIKIVDRPPKSVLAIPLYIERKLSGILWLTAEKQYATWQKYDIEILQAAGDVIMASVFKDRYQIRLTRTLRDLDTERQRIVDLAKKTIEMQERERLYFASEIHDNLLQSLVAVLYYLQMLAIPDSNKKMDERKEKLVATIKSSIDSGRALIREIEPLHAPEISLIDAVRNSIETRFIDTDTKCNFEHPKRLPQMNFAAKINLLRIIQEAIMNARKHAQANNLTVSLKAKKVALLVDIIDDGIGFSVPPFSKPPTGHLGLVTMQERAKLMEGELTVKSEPGKGTRVTGIFPLSDLRK